jgi:hypothetical protein
VVPDREVHAFKRLRKEVLNTTNFMLKWSRATPFVSLVHVDGKRGEAHVSVVFALLGRFAPYAGGVFLVRMVSE